MKKLNITMFLIICTIAAMANNIQINNVSLQGQNSVSHFSMVKFDISWDHSWRTSTLESNWDAAWVFVKFRKRNTLAWQHASLNSIGHVAPVGSTITTSLDGKGIFIYRSVNGTGTNTWTGAQLRWNYGTDMIQDFDSVEVCVFAIEMVYVPQGAFNIGDGSSTALNGQFEAGASGNPYQVTSEALITLGGGAAGSLGNHGTQGQSVADDFTSTLFGTIRSLPIGFPKGFNAYYIMKYEISQEQYSEFLNKLSWSQIARRTALSPTSVAGTAALSNTNRNGIVMQSPGVMLTSNPVFGCNLDGDAIYNEANDGQNVACNYLNIEDVSAYLDWSALRPMTELEYEKACRGANIVPVADEYAWGANSINGATGISNSGLNNEGANNAGANCTYNNAPGVTGPMRVGAFALATNRQNSGGSYYGVMELSGNVAEPVITVGNGSGRSFTGLHGDGSLDIDGKPNVSTWPSLVSSTAYNYRGGDWVHGLSLLRVSDRTNASAYFNVYRGNDCGGRGGHTAP